MSGSGRVDRSIGVAPPGGAPAELSYRLWEGDGPLVLLLPELGGGVWTWDRIAGAIAQAGFRVAIIEQRGSGASEKPPGPYSMDLFADDLAEICRAFAPGSRVVIGGLAMGAVVALHVACRHPGLVAGLGLFSPAASIDETARCYLRERADLVEREGMRAAFEMSFANAFPMPCEPNVAAAYRRQFLANCAPAYAATSRALAEFDGYSSLETFEQPTLLVSGRHDFIWPPGHGEVLAGRLPSSQFKILECAGHFPTSQTPDEVEHLLIRFLSFLKSC